jgi:hypothetical protein
MVFNGNAVKVERMKRIFVETLGTAGYCQILNVSLRFKFKI